MKPSELIRAAIVILNETGWCQGSNAKDAMGRDVGLFQLSNEGDSRAKINPDATAFSIYGAIAAAMQANPVPASRTMWEVLEQRARAVAGVRKASSHALVEYNETMDRTKEEVTDFLESAAVALEGVGQ